MAASCTKTAQPPAASANAKRFTLKGKVVSVDRVKKEATIDHDDIPGYMDAMSMPFPIHEDWVWDDLRVGSQIRADLVVDNNATPPFWLENIGIVAAPDPNQAAVPINNKFAQIGQLVPDLELTNQDGKKIDLKDYRGKVLAITFIYRECPLPDYCIRMSQNFSDAANKIAEDPGEAATMRLLSISFDPERDTPEKLKSYGLGYLGKGPNTNFKVWNLAVGTDKETRSIADFFGLRYEQDENDKTQIIHSLVTAVIGPDGKVFSIVKGNDWTTEDLFRDMKKALQG